MTILVYITYTCMYHACSVTQLCPTLCNPMDCSPSGSSVHGIFQARILEWVAISSARGSPGPRDQTSVFCISWVSCTDRQNFYHWTPWEAHIYVYIFRVIFIYIYEWINGIVSCNLIKNIEPYLSSKLSLWNCRGRTQSCCIGSIES